MSPRPAYGSEARKRALLDDIQTEGPVFTQTLTPKALETDPGEVADTYSLHPVLLRLLPVLGGFGATEAGRAFYAEALEALPVGGDPLHAVRCWLLQAWGHPIYGIAATLEGTALMDPSRAVIALVERSLNETVDKQTWRSARSAVMAAFDGADQAQDLADPVLSMAWDLDQNTGAAADVANAWGGPILWRAHAEDPDQFSEAESADLMAAMGEFNRQAMESVGGVTPGDVAKYQAFEAAVNALWAAEPRLQALRQRSADKTARANAKFAAWRQAAGQALVDCLRTTPALTPA